MTYSKSASIIFFIILCLACPGHAATRDITLQWDKSIDDPYIQSYRIYYYQESGKPESLVNYATSYTLLEEVSPSVFVAYSFPIISSDPKSITITKTHTKIILHFPQDNTKNYYFRVTSINDTHTPEQEGPPTPEISLLKLNMVIKASAQSEGTGTITSTPEAIINCSGSACSADYIGDSSVTLTATAAFGDRFIGWEGDACSGTEPCSLTVTPEMTVTATFENISTLTIKKKGVGTVISSKDSGKPSHIECGEDCTYPVSAGYAYNTKVTLTATPVAGKLFKGWYDDVAGDICVGANPCDVYMDKARTITAMFLLEGDINGDGTVNLADAILIFQLMSRGSPGGTIDRSNDMNGDGKLELADAIYILQKAADLR
jgi:hypothetical protein